MSELHNAVKDGDLQRVKSLVEKGANINVKDNEGATPLHYAALNGYLEIVRFLIEKGANINARSIAGWTPLHEAARGGHLEVVRFLIEKGANINARSNYGMTPLHWAAYMGHLGVVRLLLEAGADPNPRDSSGRTPADIAREKGYGDVAKLLEGWVEGVRAGLIVSVEGVGLVEGEWGVLRVKLNCPSTLVVEGDLDWLNPGVVQGVVDVPVKPRKAGRIPVAIVARNSGREERKIVWVEVAESMKVKSAAASCPNCGAPREPRAKYCWKCGARLADW